MDLHFLFYALMGGLVYADTDAAGQFMISQPLVAGTLAGWLLGDLTMGLATGLLLQLPYLLEAPVGGARISVASVGAYVAAAVAVKLSGLVESQMTALFLGVLYGVLIARLTVHLQDLLRKFNQAIVYRADSVSAGGALRKISSLHYTTLFTVLLFGIVVSAAFAWLGYRLLGLFVAILPAHIEASLLWFKPIFLGGGLGALLWYFVHRGTSKYTVLGAAFGLILLLII